MKTFDRHGNRVYNGSVVSTGGQWPIGTWMQKRLLTIRINEASDKLGMTGLLDLDRLTDFRSENGD